MPILSEISDVLLAAGAGGAGLYCLVLSRRLQRFTDLERGVGGAVAVLSAQVDDLTRTLTRAEDAARASAGTLGAAAGRAEAAGQRLELLLASLHDLPTAEAPEDAPAGPVFVRHPEARSWSLPREGRA
jgi:hypothetical protein